MLIFFGHIREQNWLGNQSARKLAATEVTDGTYICIPGPNLDIVETANQAEPKLQKLILEVVQEL